MDFLKKIWAAFTNAVHQLADLRFRTIYTIVGSIVVIALWLLTDPDLGLLGKMTYGASTIATLVVLTKSLLYVTLLHYSRKALFDYVDLSELFDNAKKDKDSGQALMAVAIFTLAIAVVIYAGAVG